MYPNDEKKIRDTARKDATTGEFTQNPDIAAAYRQLGGEASRVYTEEFNNKRRENVARIRRFHGLK